MGSEFISQRQAEVKEGKIVLYIKGTKETPQCGFSAAVLKIFNEIGKPYQTYNVLANTELRTRMQEFSQWPTFPQVFISGEFVGGCDIVSDMHAKGELVPLVEKAFSLK